MRERPQVRIRCLTGSTRIGVDSDIGAAALGKLIVEVVASLSKSFSTLMWGGREGGRERERERKRRRLRLILTLFYYFSIVLAFRLFLLFFESF